MAVAARRVNGGLHAEGLASVVVNGVVPAIDGQRAEPKVARDVRVEAQPGVKSGLAEPVQDATRVVDVVLTFGDLGTVDGVELAEVDRDRAVLTAGPPRGEGLLDVLQPVVGVALAGRARPRTAQT